MSHDTVKKVDANFDYVIVENTPTLLLIAFGCRVALILVDMGEDYEAPGKDDGSNSSSSVYLGV